MPDTSPRSAPSLGTRFFVATALLVIFAIGAAVLVTLFLGNQIGEEAAQKALARSSAVQEVFLARSIESLGSAAFSLAEDPDFTSYAAEAIALEDKLSLLDQLDSRRTLLGYDFAMVLDPDGRLMARSDDPNRSGEDLSGDLLFQLVSEGYQTEGLWRSENLLYEAVATPIVTGGDGLEGFLVAAYTLDDQDAIELREVNDTEVLFLMRGEEGLVPVAKTLSRGETEDLLVYLEQNPELLEIAEGSQEQREVELQQQTWLALVRPLADLGGEQIGAVINLVSLDQQLEPFRRIGRILAAVGVMAMLIALVVSYLLPKRVLLPMQRLAEAAQKASEGDYDQRIDIDGGDEVGALGRAFSKLLSELREKRDMEIYVNELARNVPSQDSSTAEAEPAARRQVMLLGLELRGGNPPDPAAGPRATLDLLTRDLRRISRSVHTQGGKVEAVVGHRIVSTFEGGRRGEQALSAAAEIASHSQGQNGTRAAAVALTAGEAITGTVTFDNNPEKALTGEAMEQLEGLLRVARTGTLLLSSRARLEFGTLFERTGVEIKEHRSTVSSSPLYSLAASAVQQFASPEITATQKMGSGTTTAFRPATLSGIGVGMVLGERFEVLSELGAGGMGVVYKAHDRSLNELVALKMLKGDLWGDPDRLDRLKDELKLARKISHPNILRTFDFGDADGYPFISMEFVRGVTLKQLLERSGRLPLSAGLRTSRQLCRGLVAAHSQGILHRDIKPENLIIEPNGNVKLMDFGIARPMQRMEPSTTEPGAIVGTPFYLAPEQLEGLEPDERADLYACGVVLYEIFTGHLPFSTQGNIFEIITRKLQEAPTPPLQYWDAMPADLERILMRCLARDRDERFADVSTLLQELEVLRA